MGVVYEALQVSLDRLVAIKVLDARLADHPSFRERFRREQRLMASLDHPNILPIYEAGEVGDQLFLAMRLVSDGSLADLITTEALEPLRAMRLIAQAASALDTAHQAGLVHRDVKPQNMLVRSDDHLYLSDFGLAAVSTEANLTRSGEFLGSLNYIAPEQIQGEPVTAAADIYALGCVLFEALTGCVPFVKASDAALLYAHISEASPRPSEVHPGLPVMLDAIVARALAKDPAERYRSAGQFAAEALAAVSNSSPTRSSPIPSSVAPPAPATPRPTTVISRRRPASPSPAPPEPIPLGTPPPRWPRWPHLRHWAHLPGWRHWSPSRRWSFWLRTASPDDGHDPPSDVSASAARQPRPSQTQNTPARSWWDEDERANGHPESGGVVPPPPSGSSRFQLRPGFRYVHEPLADERDGIPLLGNAEVVAMLKERIVRSNGGAFLITGFRGVGKTTVIARALSELQSEADSVAILPVRINVARPRSVEELLFEIIRRVFETLKDEDLLSRMSPRVQRELLLAYARTSLSFNETRSKASEQTRGISVGLPSLLEALAPKLETSRKISDSLASQAAFLAYTDADVEHDFLRIVSLVERGENVHADLKRGRGRRAGVPLETWQGKLVVVIDELDKLTADDEGMRCVSTLLSGLKNLLTARGVHFLFVAGPDLHDIALRESRRGNSVFESVFSWQFYVPCLWQATDRLLDAVLDEEVTRTPLLETLRDYLRFKSRGVPRLLLMELNSLVRWESDDAYLEVSGTDRARLQFYADLERVVRGFVGESHGAQPLDLAIDQDRWKLGAYYVTDWILRSEGVPFTVDTLVGAEKQLALHPVFTLSPTKVRDFLDHLVEHGIVLLTPRRSADRTYQGDVPSAQQDVFQLAPEYRVKLSEFARVNERERADLRADGPRREPWADSRVGGDVGHGRYELLEELDREGLGRVYRARDRNTFQECAVKLFDPLVSPQNDVIRTRFERAAQIARSLSHPNIVATIATFEEDGRLGIVMALVAGTPLSRLLEHAKLTPPEAVRIASRLAGALDHVHTQGVARIDLKPSSIVVDDELNPIILDLGLAKVIDASAGERGDVTAAGAVLGTPAYAAPEQLRGEPADIRTDIYALGLILYEMIAGRRARRGDFSAVVAQKDAHVDLEQLDVSDELRTTIRTALAAHPDDRYSEPSLMQQSLLSTAEAQLADASRPS